MASHDTVEPDHSTKKGGDRLQCVVVTPERTLFDELVDFVALPLYDGELGVLPGRSPLIGRLGYGELRTKEAGVAKSYFVDGGFVQVRDNVVTVLTNRAIPSDKVNVEAAERELDQAKARRATSDFEMAEKAKAVDRARAQIHVAKAHA
ncbi:ATP synthase F1 subunit epsilon [Singulisphaera sp. PoT]|uniref:ATP synthase F1 subunit epsilon n=1 Tax=Singulisphaera sp. PoT TaxID=3411797 RepID=UPI003BF5EB6E